MEHPLDRLIRVHKEDGKVLRWHDDGDDGFQWITGKSSKIRWYYWKNPVTILNECQCCRIKSTPKKVCYRGDICYWNGLEDKPKDRWRTPARSNLCWSCYNKIKPIVKRLEEAERLLSLVNKTRKIFNESTKNNA